MGLYIVLSTLTEEGRKTIKKHPNRLFEVNEELEKIGVKVLEQYAMLGPYDFLSIVEALDPEQVMNMSVELGSRGTVTMISFPATPIKTFIKNLSLLPRKKA
jgi:uncharacterized protein with GYD domain